MRILNLIFAETEKDVKDGILVLPEDDFMAIFKPIVVGNRNRKLKRRVIEWLSCTTQKSDESIIKGFKNNRLP